MEAQGKDILKRAPQIFPDKLITATKNPLVSFETKKAQPINIPGVSQKKKTTYTTIVPFGNYLELAEEDSFKKTHTFIVGSLQEKTPVPWPLNFETAYSANKHRSSTQEEVRGNQLIFDQLEDKTDMTDLIFDMDDSDASSCDDLAEVCKP